MNSTIDAKKPDSNYGTNPLGKYQIFQKINPDSKLPSQQEISDILDDNPILKAHFERMSQLRSTEQETQALENITTFLKSGSWVIA